MRKTDSKGLEDYLQELRYTAHFFVENSGHPAREITTTLILSTTGVWRLHMKIEIGPDEADYVIEESSHDPFMCVQAALVELKKMLLTIDTPVMKKLRHIDELIQKIPT